MLFYVVAAGLLLAVWALAVPAAAHRGLAWTVALGLACGLLLYPSVTMTTALGNVCDTYERQGFVNCGGIDGDLQQIRLAGLLLLLACAVHLRLAVVLHRRHHKPTPRGAHVR